MTEEKRDFPDDPDAPPSAEEIAASERLREALEDRSAAHPDAELARALKHAVSPRAIESATHKKILDRTVPATRARTTVVYFAGALAAAAAIALLVNTLPKSSSNAPPQIGADDLGASLTRVHPADDLFDAPFPKDQPTSERIDKIATARARDLRANRYARWGVK